MTTTAAPASTPDTATNNSTEAPAIADDPRVHLPLPDQVTPGKLLWPYVISIGLFHVLALLALVPYFFTWTAAITAVVGIFVFGQGINLCYHRLLSHRSFVVPGWLERFFVIVALCCLQDTPGKWVAIHRFHHNHSDHQPDPHSPLVNFLWSHVGWLVIRNPGAHNIAVYRKYASDILSNPFYLKLEKTLLWVWIYIAHAALFTAIGFGVGWFVGGDLATAARFGASMLVWGVILRTVLVWHITWSVNSLTHLFGYQRYKNTDDNSRNNWLVGLVAVGEGWHNNHHHDPAAATTQRSWWEIDMTYYFIVLLERVGLATRVTKPREQRHAERAAAAAE